MTEETLLHEALAQPPAERAAFPKTNLPQHFPLLVRVKRVSYAGFLTDHQRSFPVRKRNQNGRLSEIEVRPVRVRAVGFSGLSAIHSERVVRGHLTGPQHFASGPIQC